MPELLIYLQTHMQNDFVDLGLTFSKPTKNLRRPIMGKILTGAIISICLALGCGSGTNVKIAKDKFSSIKRVALFQTIFEKPFVDAQKLRGNLFTGLIADKFDKEFALILPDLLTAELAAADSIRTSVANKLASELGLTVSGGSKLTSTKEYTSLGKNGLINIPIEPFTREGFAFVQASGEKNFIKPVQDTWGGNLDESFRFALEGDEAKSVTKKICELLKVDGLVISINQIDATVYSNGSSAGYTSHLLIIDREGTIVLTAKAVKGESLQGGGDLAGFKTLLGHSETIVQSLFANIKLEQTQK